MRTKFQIFFILLISFSTCNFLFAQKRAFTLDDLYKVKNVGAPVISPDGKQILYTITESNLPEGKSSTEIYKMNFDGSNKSQLELTDKSDFNPFWNNDGKGFYFVSSKSGASQINFYNLANKQVKQITDFYSGVSDPVISPNGKLIAFAASVFPDCGADQECNKLNQEAMDKGPIQANMADELLYRHWTEYSAGKFSHIFVYDIAKNEYKDLTPGNWESPVFMAGGGIGFNFSPDSKEICFASKRVEDPASSTNSDLWIVPVSGGEPRNITRENEGWDGTPIYSPDGKYIAFRKQIIPRYEADVFTIALYERVTGKISTITNEFDNWVNDFVWSKDSKEIYFNGDVQGYSPVYKIELKNNKIQKLTDNRSIFGFDISPDKKYLVYNSRSVGKPAEIYSLELKNKKETELTFANKEFNEEVDVRPAEQIWVEGAEGKKVHTFIVKPHGFDSTKKYPVILNVHGGPQSQWMDAFRGDWQVYPGYGYIVVFANPHGSTGYGQDYTLAISGDWGGKPYEDLMKVVDEIEKLPFVDTERIGAMGWSYGGYMVNWFQAKTKRFKCLASMMGLYDLRSFFGTTEELWFPEFDLKGQPWNSDLYEKFSPSNFVENFATPTLIVTGEKDYRVSYTQSLHYFTDLQKKGIESRLIVFENDGHWPSHVKSMPLYYNSHLEWFHKYLGGEPAPYDSKMMIGNRAFENKGESSNK